MAVGIEDYLDLTGGSGASVRIWYKETYDIEKNTSTVAITSIQVMSTWYAGVTYYLDGTISIAGTVAVSMSSSGGTHPVTISAMNQYYTAGGSLGSVSGIAHLNDGSQSVTISANIRGYTQSGGAGSGWSASGSKVSKLTTIPRKSSLTASNGTLGVDQTLKVTKKADGFTHTITYKCRDESGTICSESKDTSIAWTPPIELAEQNMTGTSVTVNLTITTYSGNTTIGSSTVPVSYAIPESVAPTCSLRIQDYSGFDTTYGGMIKGCSRMVIMVDSESQYGAIISSHRITADGVVYSEPSVITDYIKTSGILTVTATVTDSRGRTASTSMDVEVIDYTMPTVSVLKVRRCNEDGSTNESGDFVQVTFSSEVTALNDQNTALYKLEYKKASEEEFTSVSLTDFMNQYSVTDGTYIFEADGGSTYEVRLSITDNFNTGRRTVPVSTGATIMHFLASGNGMGIGKMGELENTLDIGWDIQMNGKKVSGLPTPTEGGDAVPLSYFMEAIRETWFPVGTILNRYDHRSPAEFIGGTWTRIENSFLWGIAESGTIGETGGEKTHTLTTNEMPKHSHNPMLGTTRLGGNGGTSSGWRMEANAAWSQVGTYATTASAGGGAAHNNMPPYTNVSIWRRIA